MHVPGEYARKIWPHFSCLAQAKSPRGSPPFNRPGLDPTIQVPPCLLSSSRSHSKTPLGSTIAVIDLSTTAMWLRKIPPRNLPSFPSLGFEVHPPNHRPPFNHPWVHWINGSSLSSSMSTSTSSHHLSTSSDDPQAPPPWSLFCVEEGGGSGVPRSRHLHFEFTAPGKVNPSPILIIKGSPTAFNVQ